MNKICSDVFSSYKEIANFENAFLGKMVLFQFFLFVLFVVCISYPLFAKPKVDVWFTQREGCYFYQFLQEFSADHSFLRRQVSFQLPEEVQQAEEPSSTIWQTQP